MSAISQYWKLNPAAISTFNSVELKGGKDVNFSLEGDAQTVNSDGQKVASNVFVNNIRATATVNISDSGLVNTANLATFTPGKVASLVLNTVQRSEGSEVTATTRNYTFAKACLVSASPTVSHDGESQLTLVFNIFNNGSDGLVSISS